MRLLHLSSHLYVLTRQYYRQAKKVLSLKKEADKYIHSFHTATSLEDKQKYHHKAQKSSKKHQEALHEQHKLMLKMNSFCAGFARELQQEARDR